jgi:hypothetical protein
MTKIYTICILLCLFILSLPRAEACSVGGRVFSDTLLRGARPGIAILCPGGSATLYLRGQKGKIQYWEFSDDSVSWRRTATRDTFPFLTTPALTARRWYRANIKDGACPEVLSKAVRINIEPSVIPGTLVSDKATYTCSEDIRLSARGFRGQVIGYEYNHPLEPCSARALRSSSDTTTIIPAGFYPESIYPYTLCANAVIVNQCGDTVRTPVISVTVTKPTPLPFTLRAVRDSLCLGGAPFKVVLDGYDGRPINWHANVGLVFTTTPPGRFINQPCGDSTSFITDQVSEIGRGEYNLNINWDPVMFESGYWEEYKRIHGEYPKLCLYVSDGRGSYCMSRSNRIEVPIFYPARSIGGVVETDRIVCSGNTPGPLNLFGHKGRIVRWESSTDDGITWTAISNTTASLTPPALTASTWYRAVVDNSGCDGAKPSLPAKITVVPSPIGGTITGDSEVCFSEDSTLLTLNGHRGQIKRWEISYDDGGTWTPFPHIAATLLLGPQTRSATYRAIVNSTGCPDVPSAGFKLNVVREPVAIGGEISAKYDTLCARECADLKLKYHVGNVVHWEKADNCDPRNWTPFGRPNQTSISECGFVPATCCDFTPSTVCFRALLRTDLRCRTAYSTVQRIVIDNRPCLGGGGGIGGVCNCACTKPLCSGQSTTINLSSHGGKILYWEKAPTRDTSSWTTIANTTTTLGTGPLSESTCFRAVVERRGVIYRSTPTCVAVNPATVGGVLSAERASVCIGEDSGPMVLKDYVGDVISWIYSDDGEVTWQSIPGGLGKDRMRSLKMTKNIAVKVQVRGCLSDVFSNTIRIAVAPGTKSEGGRITGSETVCSGGTTTLRLTDYFGNIVRWEASFNNWATVFTITHTDSAFTTIPITTPTLYRVVVQSGACNTESSTDFTVFPVTSLGGFVSARHRTVCRPGGRTDLELVGFSGNILNWESSIDGSTWTPIAATTARFTATGINTTTQYRAKVQNGTCPVATSSALTINTVSPANAGTLTSDQTVCSGNQMVSLNLTGHSGVIQRWERSIDGGSTWAKIEYVFPSYSSMFDFTVNTRYRVVTFIPTCDTLFSNAVSFTVNPGPVGGKVSGGTAVCGSRVKTELVLSGHDGSIVRWETRTDASPVWTAIANTTDKQLVDITSGTATVYYRAVITKGGCTTRFSTEAAIEFYPAPKAGILYGHQTTCTGNVAFPLSYKGFNGMVMHWETSTDSITWTTVSKRDSVWTPGPLAATTYYRVVSGNPACRLLTSNVVRVTVTAGASVGKIAASSTCTSNPVLITATGFSGRIYRWEQSIDGGTTWRYFAGSTPILTTPAHTRATTYRYWVFCGSDTITGSPGNPITIQLGPSLGTLTASSSSICTGTSVRLDLSSFAGGTLALQYSADCFTTPGTSTPVASFPQTLTPTASGCYRVVLTSATCGTLTTPTVRVDVTAAPPVGTITGERTICAGLSGGVLRLTGHGGTIERWEASSDCAAFSSPTDLGNAGNANLGVGIVPSTSCFRAVLRSACGLQFSPTARITVHPTARVSARYVADGACGGGDARIEATATGGSGSYRFYLDPGVMSENRTGIFVNPPPGIYNVNAQDLATGCITNTVVTVDPALGSATIISLDPTQTTALVRWMGPVGTGVTYNVRYRIVGSSVWTTRSGITMTAVSLVGLQNGTRYETQVEVVCPGGRSIGWSPVAPFTTLSDGSCMTTPIAKPGGVYIRNLRPRNATIKWNPVAGARGYIIQFWIKGGSSRTASSVAVCAPRDSFNVPGLVPGRTYVYRIQTSCSICAAGARVGLSSWSSDFEFTTPSIREEGDDLTAIHSDEMVVYPNPNKGAFTVQLFSMNEEPIVLHVYDLKGQLVAERQWTATNGEMQLPVELNAQASGIYLLQVSQGEFRWNTKLMID